MLIPPYAAAHPVLSLDNPAKTLLDALPHVALAGAGTLMGRGICGVAKICVITTLCTARRYAMRFLQLGGAGALTGALSALRPPAVVVRHALAALEALTRSCGAPGCEVALGWWAPPPPPPLPAAAGRVSAERRAGDAHADSRSSGGGRRREDALENGAAGHGDDGVGDPETHPGPYPQREEGSHARGSWPGVLSGAAAADAGEAANDADSDDADYGASDADAYADFDSHAGGDARSSERSPSFDERSDAGRSRAGQSPYPTLAGSDAAGAQLAEYAAPAIRDGPPHLLDMNGGGRGSGGGWEGDEPAETPRTQLAALAGDLREMLAETPDRLSDDDADVAVLEPHQQSVNPNTAINPTRYPTAAATAELAGGGRGTAEQGRRGSPGEEQDPPQGPLQQQRARRHEPIRWPGSSTGKAADDDAHGRGRSAERAYSGRRGAPKAEAEGRRRERRDQEDPERQQMASNQQRGDPDRPRGDPKRQRVDPERHRGESERQRGTLQRQRTDPAQADAGSSGRRERDREGPVSRIRGGERCLSANDLPHLSPPNRPSANVKMLRPFLLEAVFYLSCLWCPTPVRSDSRRGSCEHVCPGPQGPLTRSKKRSGGPASASTGSSTSTGRRRTGRRRGSTGASATRAAAAPGGRRRSRRAAARATPRAPWTLALAGARHTATGTPARTTRGMAAASAAATGPRTLSLTQVSHMAASAASPPARGTTAAATSRAATTGGRGVAKRLHAASAGVLTRGQG